MNRILASIILFGALCLVAPRQAPAVTIQWSPVGSPGNPGLTVARADGTRQFGSVGYSYNIGKYDVTNSQYAEFLNTKDPSGANKLGLWNSQMADAAFGGISFNSGNASGQKYVLIAGRQNHPVNSVTWFSAERFANWLNNGQGNGSTETGAYTLARGGPRNAGARVFLPSEDEWYKAAYYNPATGAYFQYPTGNDTTPTAEIPPGGSNSANYGFINSGNLTDVGAYTGTTSPFGAFDMGGNVFQWTEGLYSFGQVVHGGAFDFESVYMTPVFLV